MNKAPLSHMLYSMQKQAISWNGAKFLLNRGKGLVMGSGSAWRWAQEGVRKGITGASKKLLSPVANAGARAARGLAGKGMGRAAKAVQGVSDFVGGAGRFAARTGHKNRFFTQGLPNMIGRTGSFGATMAGLGYVPYKIFEEGMNKLMPQQPQEQYYE